MGNKSSKGKKDPTTLTDDDLNMLKVNTQYSEEEIQAWHSGFLKDCPSGRLDKKQFLSVYRVSHLDAIVIFSHSFIRRNSILKVKRINIVISFSKHSIRIIIIGLISLNSCKRIQENCFHRQLFTSRLAVGVSQHGNLEDKLKMAFDIYGKLSHDNCFIIIVNVCQIKIKMDKSIEKI